MVTRLAQSNRGKEAICLFCVYGSSGYGGMAVLSASLAANTNGIYQTYHRLLTTSESASFFILQTNQCKIFEITF